MLRFLLLSLVLACCQGELCGVKSIINCSCRNGIGKPVYTSSHQKRYNSEWITSITGAGPFCDSKKALHLWNIITSSNCMCTPTPTPKTTPPPRYERPSESEMIGKGYERHGLSLYKFHNVTQDWENARRKCKSEGAHLAVVNSEAEAKILEFIFARYPVVPNTMNNYDALIGFHDQFTEGNYLTIFGEPIEAAGYSQWYGDNPNNFGKDLIGNPGQNCGSISRKGGLDDVFCDGRFAFFCELEDGQYPRISEIDYSAGYYTGVEDVIMPPPGKVRRLKPSSGYTYYYGVGFYKMHTLSDTWENARRICESEDAHLAIINSEQESAVLSVVFSKHKVIYDRRWNDFAFIGFHDQYAEGDFLTIYNETLESTGFTKWWAIHEPNNSGATKINVGQDCGAVHRNGGLNDLACHKRHAFICEQPLLQ